MLITTNDGVVRVVVFVFVVVVVVVVVVKGIAAVVDGVGVVVKDGKNGYVSVR